MIEKAADSRASDEKKVETFFAPPERLDGGDLARSVDLVSKDPLIGTLLKSAGGLLAVLNEQRQILAVNDTLLKTLGMDDTAQDAFGLRPGEAVDCVHAREMEGGCGTSRFCASCGAAVAIVSCLSGNTSVDRDCAITVNRESGQEELFFRVHASPVTIESSRLVLLFLQDMTSNQRASILGRAFMHDMRNMVGGLIGNAELLSRAVGEAGSEEAKQILDLTFRLARDMRVHSAILYPSSSGISVRTEEVSMASVAEELSRIFRSHAASKGKRLSVSHCEGADFILSDRSLLMRALVNAVTNAFEATPAGGEVRFWVEHGEDEVVFCIWNAGAIQPDIAVRIFQLFFSSKAGEGRGIGTYAMKLLVEDYLDGAVSFTSTEQDGTIFRITTPNGDH